MTQKITVKSPGRINIIGEHTDYNDGFVLPAAIDKNAVFVLHKNKELNDYRCQVTAENVGETLKFDLQDVKPLEKNGWENYVLGVIHELQKLGAKFTGFTASFTGTVPIGGGMSSSAALECSLAFAINEMFDLGLDKWQLIKASQMAEHNFVGIKCGIMDQFASMMGKKDQVMLLDCRSLAYEYFPFNLGNYKLLLLNTNVSHSLASSAYNKRREECEEGVAILQEKNPKIKNLRDATLSMLALRKASMSDTVFKRCHHVISENDRVLKATQALKEEDYKQLGGLIYASHASLQNDYEVSCEELDFLVDFTKDKDYILGSRMMGGGFGGCTINVIEKTEVDHFIALAAKAYEQKFGKALTPYQVSIENGAEVV